ncbi:MarR family transcriptional regulator [Parelusimicrobium proximum]|uniref:MarR family transcriptional regulator n=1 Tax=Parelusimicrobium proximum TaxID=3228953 RepID=UPI003D186046
MKGLILKIATKQILSNFRQAYFGLLKRKQKFKEIYFKLTNKGRQIYKSHEELHLEFQKRDNGVFAKITDKQFNAMIDFAQKYISHLDSEIKKLNISAK